jgi:hypothetical protein
LGSRISLLSSGAFAYLVIIVALVITVQQAKSKTMPADVACAPAD